MIFYLVFFKIPNPIPQVSLLSSGNGGWRRFDFVGRFDLVAVIRRVRDDGGKLIKIIIFIPCEWFLTFSGGLEGRCD